MIKRRMRLFLRNTADASLAMLQAQYAAQVLSATLTSAFKTAGVVYVNSTTSFNRRMQVYEINVGQTASAYASTDTSALWDVSRLGASSGLAATAITPNPLDADVACFAVFANNATTEPTYTTQGNGLSIYSWSVNQRGFNRWRALDDGDNIIVPSVAFNGIGTRVLSPGGTITTASGIGTLAFIER